MLLYRRRIGQWSDRLLTAFFLLALGLPLVGFLLGRGGQARTERRPLAPRPALNLHGRVWKDFPRAFDAYFNDHFGFRGSLIECGNALKARGLHVSPSPFVLIGQDGWLFFRPAPPEELPGPFTPDELRAWQRVLEGRQRWLARRGCRYLLFLPPNKETVYPEYLPRGGRPYASVRRLGQLVEHLRRHSTVPVVDVRAALKEAGRHEQTYFKTDSHWNGRGAFVGYQQLTGQLSEWFPAVRPLPRSAFRETRSVGRAGDLAEMLGEDQATEERLDLEPLRPRRAQRCAVRWPAGVELPRSAPTADETDDDRLPRAVVFHDSFHLALAPFLAEHFRRVVCCWQDDFCPEIVERERPDVVIQELLERKLLSLTPDDIPDEAPGQ